MYGLALSFRVDLFVYIKGQSRGIMRTPLVVGNWKMNGSRSSIKLLLDGIRTGIDGLTDVHVAVCAPYVYLSDVWSQLHDSPITWGGQNVSHEGKGAFTGEISVSMLQDFNCKYVIIGHSERRALYSEDNGLVARKFAVVRKTGMIPLLCVGESLEERESGVTEQVIARQLDAVIELVGVGGLRNAVVAYEPVWAIGTGKTATPEQAQEVHAFIRGRIGQREAEVADGLQILYGGSVKSGNATELFAMPDIDGGLIGGASLVADEFLNICQAANQV